VKICLLCEDAIYDGEAADGEPHVHSWCHLFQMAIGKCTQAMHVRRIQGLPTPMSPLFRDPRKGAN